MNPDKELLIPVWQGEYHLKFCVTSSQEVLEGFWTICDWFEDRLENQFRPFRFILGFGPETKELIYARGKEYSWTKDSLTQEPGAFVARLQLEIAAPHEELALRRLGGLQALISTLLSEGYELFTSTGLCDVISVSDVSAVEPQRVPVDAASKQVDQDDPFGDLRLVFFPFLAEWLDEEDVGAFSETDIRAVKLFDAWRILNPGTDDLNEAVTSLEVLAEMLSYAAVNAQRWNWVFIATHHALQGFMVQALQYTDTDRFNILKERVMWEEKLEEWKKKIEQAPDAKPPTPPKSKSKSRDDWVRRVANFRLPDFWILYRGIKMPDFMLQRVDSQVFQPDAGTDEAIVRLTKLRNDFVHFAPRLTVYHPNEEFPDLIAKCISAIRFLAFQSNNVNWDDDKLRRRTETALNTIDEHLAHMRRHYAETIAYLRSKGDENGD